MQSTFNNYVQAALGSPYQLVCSNHRRPVFACRHVRKQASNWLLFQQRKCPPRRSSVFCWISLRWRGQTFAPTYAGLDMLKIEGGINRFCLETGVRLLVAEEKIWSFQVLITFWKKLVRNQRKTVKNDRRCRLPNNHHQHGYREDVLDYMNLLSTLPMYYGGKYYLWAMRNHM